MPRDPTPALPSRPTTGAAPTAQEVARSVALLRTDPMLGEHLIGAQIAASDLAGAWWRPSAGVSRADRRRGEGPRDPVSVSRAYAGHLERAGDPHALTVLRALQVGADPEWRPAVAAAADRLASRGVREPTWWPPERERVGRCCTFPWGLPDGRFDALTIEVFQGALRIALSVVVDAEGTITDVLLLTEMVALFEMPEEHGGTIEGDPRWRAPGELADRLEQAIDRTDLLGLAPPPSFLPGTGYPAFRGLLRTWIELTREPGPSAPTEPGT